MPSGLRRMAKVKDTAPHRGRQMWHIDDGFVADLVDLALLGGCWGGAHLAGLL